LPKYFFADPLECSGCRICELVCSFTFEKVIDPNKARIKVITRGHLDKPIACRNCQDAPCLEACKSRALYIETRRA